MNTQTRPEFQTEADAWDWLAVQVEMEDCVDNHRFAFEDDDAAMVTYNQAAWDGCCGSCDYDIIVAGRLACIGCNYGH